MPVPGVGGGEVVGTISSLNSRFRKETAGANLAVTHAPVAGKGHGDVPPPRAIAETAFSRKRGPVPRAVEHRFRHAYHGRAWWLGARGAWIGQSWEARPPEKSGGGKDRPSPAEAVDRQLGLLQGAIENNRVTISGRHVEEFRLRFTGELLDLSQPVTIAIAGRPERTVTLEPTLGFALREAVASFDFDRIWWAGWESDSPAPTATPVTD